MRRTPVATSFMTGRASHGAFARGYWHDLGDVLPLTGAATATALTAVEQYRLSFWDALVWATARDADVPVVLSEDFQDGREIEGVRFVNPFKQS